MFALFLNPLSVPLRATVGHLQQIPTAPHTFFLCNRERDIQSHTTGLDMYPTAAILLLLLGNAIGSEKCQQLLEVPNAQLEEPKEVYQKGDTVSFVCDMGYISGRQIRHVCTDNGWVPEHRAMCRLKPCVLPDDIPNGFYQITVGEDFVFGTTIKYFCNEGYQMVSKEDTRTCFLQGWSNHLPICESLSCEPPAPVPGVLVEGLPSDDGPILPDRFLTFSCDDPTSSLNSSSTLVCGKDGKWDNPFPYCVGVTCELPAPSDRVRVLGAEGGRVAPGNSVTVQCVTGGGATQVECLPSGQWRSTFPTCSDTCDVTHVSDTVLVSPRNSGRQVQRGQRLYFRCANGRHVLRGATQVTCLEDGQWSHPFPSCSDPYSCGTPPPLENGDYLSTTTQFDHNTRVQYLCQAKYVMEGRPYKTCNQGVWTGEIKCLKPCTVNPALMGPNKITFTYSSADKLYATHKDFISFSCTHGATHDGQVALRQQCIDGHMPIPTCT